jgi:DNA-binding XRE family transcriptional regulator
MSSSLSVTRARCWRYSLACSRMVSRGSVPSDARSMRLRSLLLMDASSFSSSLRSRMVADCWCVTVSRNACWRASALSQERAAHAAGISTFTYRKLEKGESNPGTPANPRLRTLVALAEVFGATVEELIPKKEPSIAVGR